MPLAASSDPSRPRSKNGAPRLPPGWVERGHKLLGAYRFKDFQQAMSFLVEVAFRAEIAEHHPDFGVHYNEVRFEVWSHDVGRVTERDRALVDQIAAAAARHGAHRLPP